MCVLLLATACAASNPDATSAPATSAPDFTALDLYGRSVRLSDFRGKRNVVLVFYIGHT